MPTEHLKPINCKKNTPEKEVVQLAPGESWEIIQEAETFFILVRDALGWSGQKDKETARIELINAVGQGVDDIKKWVEENVCFFVPQR